MDGVLMTKKQEASKRITSLADMANFSPAYDVEVEHEGDVLVFPCKMLSYADWQAAALRVPEPVPPINGVDKAGRPVMNRNDAGYLRDRTKAADLRSALRLAQFVQIELPGETPEAQAQALMDTLPPAVFNGLIMALEAAFRGRAARVHARAGTFRPDGDTDTEGTEGA